MTSLSARSVVASTLLGTLPPQLPGRLLVAFAEEFGISPGTTRVALSRMVERGELVRDDDGVHGLSGLLLERQSRQEAGLAPDVANWDGDWEMVVLRSGGRGSGERAALRRAAIHLGLGEHREGVWMRPANLDPARLPASRVVVDAQADRFIGQPQERDPKELVATIFDLAGWASEAARLEQQMAAPGLGLADGFEVAAAVLRHLVADPLLPEALWPTAWPAGQLRLRYAAYNDTYRARLSAFFRSRSRVSE